MITTPIKALAVARGKPAQPERTVANELPQELSKLSEKSWRPKKAAVVPKTHQRAVITTTGFTDDGHPTILAAPRGLIAPGGKIPRR